MLCYDDTVEFVYNDGQHKYTVSKKVGETWTTPVPVTGITTITSIINKEALVPWAAKITAETFVELLQGDPSMKLAVAAAEARKAPQNAANKGKGAGTIAHKLVEALHKGKDVIMPEDPEMRVVAENIKIQHLAFEKDFEPENIHVEKPMYSLKHDFAGTDDVLCKMGGKTILIDYKSTNRGYYNPDGIYAENFAQLGGQSILVEEMLGTEVDDLWIVNFAKDSQEYKVRQLSEMKLTKTDAQLYFLHCLGLYNINKQFEWRNK